jgi:hypothetical protein
LEPECGAVAVGDGISCNVGEWNEDAPFLFLVNDGSSGEKEVLTIKKIPTVTNVKGKSLKTAKSGAMLLKLPIGFRGRRLLTRRFASKSRNRRINPNMRVAQANPTTGKSLCSINGKMIPPMDPEVMAIPVALPRFRRKK